MLLISGLHAPGHALLLSISRYIEQFRIVPSILQGVCPNNSALSSFLHGELLLHAPEHALLLVCLAFFASLGGVRGLLRRLLHQRLFESLLEGVQQPRDLQR